MKLLSRGFAPILMLVGILVLASFIVFLNKNRIFKNSEKFTTIPTPISQMILQTPAPEVVKPSLASKPIQTPLLISRPEKFYTASEFLESGYIKPVEISTDEKCIQLPYPPKLICNSLGEYKINQTITVKILPVYEDSAKSLDKVNKAKLVFFENGNRSTIKDYVTFWSADMPFLSVKLSYLDDKNIYIDDESGHEVGFSNYYWNGLIWNKLEVWNWIKDDFPDIYEPIFSTLVSNKYIKVVEENYCCDIVYNSDDPVRVKYREVYTLDRNTKSIIKKEQTPR